MASTNGQPVSYFEKHKSIFTKLRPIDHGNQTSDLSWWPKQTTFMRSGMWIGYWTPWCEKWFNQRLEEIRNGTAILRTSREWNQYLTFYLKSTGKLLRANDAASTSYLDRILKQ